MSVRGVVRGSVLLAIATVCVVVPSTAAAHGMPADGPTQHAGGLLPVVADAVAGASAGSIKCVPALSPVHAYRLVYAVPEGANISAAREAQARQALIDSVEQASARINAETQLRDPRLTLRLPVQCANGVPSIEKIAIGIPPEGASKAAIGFALWSKGAWSAPGLELLNPNPMASVAPRRTIVFVEAPATENIAGFGTIVDSSAASSNATANWNGGAAVIVRPKADSLPNHFTVLHEVLHTMGAVSDDVTGSTSENHCTIDEDVMCYDDGDPNKGIVEKHKCAFERIDCAGNMYFNPHPASRNYLANHWNIAASYNAWLARGTTGAGAIFDTTPPPVPSGLRIASTAPGRVTVELKMFAPTAHVKVYGYRVDLSDGNGGFTEGTFTNGARYSSTPNRTRTKVLYVPEGRAFRIAVRAVDQQGNEGRDGLLFGSTAPLRPLGLKAVPDAQARTLDLSWISDEFNAGSVRSYLVSYHASSWADGVVRNVTVRGGWVQIPNYAATDQYDVSLTAIGAGGLRSVPATLTVRATQTVPTPREQITPANVVMTTNFCSFSATWERASAAPGQWSLAYRAKLQRRADANSPWEDLKSQDSYATSANFAGCYGRGATYRVIVIAQRMDTREWSNWAASRALVWSLAPAPAGISMHWYGNQITADLPLRNPGDPDRIEFTVLNDAGTVLMTTYSNNIWLTFTPPVGATKVQFQQMYQAGVPFSTTVTLPIPPR